MDKPTTGRNMITPTDEMSHDCTPLLDSICEGKQIDCTEVFYLNTDFRKRLEDSILFQTRDGHWDAVKLLKKEMFRLDCMFDIVYTPWTGNEVMDKSHYITNRIAGIMQNAMNNYIGDEITHDTMKAVHGILETAIHDTFAKQDITISCPEQFEIEATINNDIITVVPKNLYTGLLLCGIEVVWDDVKNVDSYEHKGCRFEMVDDSFKKSIINPPENVEITFTVK